MAGSDRRRYGHCDIYVYTTWFSYGVAEREARALLLAEVVWPTSQEAAGRLIV